MIITFVQRVQIRRHLAMLIAFDHQCEFFDKLWLAMAICYLTHRGIRPLDGFVYQLAFIIFIQQFPRWKNCTSNGSFNYDMMAKWYPNSSPFWPLNLKFSAIIVQISGLENCTWQKFFLWKKTPNNSCYVTLTKEFWYINTGLVILL